MNILVIAHPHDPLAYFVATAFHQSFLSLGYTSSILPQYEAGFDVCLVMYAHVQYNFPKDSTYKIAYNWECLPHPRWRKNVRRMAHQFNCIWECSQENLKVSLPIRHVYCPIGYHRSFEMPATVGDVRNISFLGYLPPKNPYRKRIVDSIEKELGLQIWYAKTQSEYIHHFSDSRIPIADIIHNTQIHLNIHQNSAYPMFESIRVLSFLLSNKKFIISENSCDSPLINKVHYVETDRFPDTIKYYLAQPEEREQIAQQGYSFISKHYRMEEHIAKALHETDCKG